MCYFLVCSILFLGISALKKTVFTVGKLITILQNMSKKTRNKLHRIETNSTTEEPDNGDFCLRGSMRGVGRRTHLPFALLYIANSQGHVNGGHSLGLVKSYLLLFSRWITGQRYDFS